MADIGISALATFLVPIFSVIGGIFYMVKWGREAITKQVEALDKSVRVTTDNLDHKVRNTVSRVDTLEHVRQSDVERIVKLETALQGVERSMERLEKGQDKLEGTINDRFDQLAASIREVRTVTPRS